jgi:hypothetical protein
MPRQGNMRSLLLIGLLLGAGVAVASPCDSVKRDLSESQRAEWAAVIAKQLDVPKVTVLQSFRSNAWTIVYVTTPNSDPPFLFFDRAPGKAHFVTLWSGGAQANEEASIHAWVIENAPGIPPDLAACFAWHVAKARDL